jgi:glucose/mannose transport system permease protein
LPNYEFVGWAQYATLFESERWVVALTNPHLQALFIGVGLALGLLWLSC